MNLDADKGTKITAGSAGIGVGGLLVWVAITVGSMAGDVREQTRAVLDVERRLDRIDQRIDELEQRERDRHSVP